MDKTVKNRQGAVTGHPVVAHANWYQFGPGEIAIRSRVESRMLLWCVSGTGRICVNSEWRQLPPRAWVLLPWAHRIRYEADSKLPFFVGGVHIIPWHEDRAKLEFHVAHDAADALANHPARRNVLWPGMEALVAGQFIGDLDPLSLLATYTVEKFQKAEDRPSATRLAEMLVQELRAASLQRMHSIGKPAALLRIEAYARAHLDRQVTVEDLALLAECSVASVHRLFRDFEETSPGRWMSQLRAERAAYLLRTTSRSIGEIGVQLGMPDPFHFSRFFKREMGMPPRLYRQSRRFV